MRWSPRSNRLSSALALACAGATLAASGLLAQGLATYEPAATRGDPFPLTIRSIMRGSELVGQAPVGIRWSDDGEWVYFRWLPGGEDWHADRELYRVRGSGGDPEVVADEEADALAPVLAGGDVSSDGRWRAVSADGDLYVIERATGRTRQLTHTAEAERGPVFSGDGGEVYFRRDLNLFAFDLEDGAIRQVTYNASGPEPEDETEAEGQEGFLEAQQTELFEHVRIEALREERRDAREERRRAGRPETLYLKTGERANRLVPDPTGRYVAVTATTRATSSESTDIPRWITSSGYTENTEMRPKVGDDQSRSRLAIVDAETGEATWIDVTAETEPAGEAESGDVPEPPRVTFVGWDDTGAHGLVSTLDVVDQPRLVHDVEGGDEPVGPGVVPPHERHARRLGHVARLRLSGRLRLRRHVDPRRLACLGIDDRETRARLVIAHLGSHLRVLGVAGARDPARDVGALAARRPSRRRHRDVAAGRVWNEAVRPLARLQVQRLGSARAAALLPRVPSLFPQRLDADVLEQLRLLGLEEPLLSFGLGLVFRLGPGRVVGHLPDRSVLEIEREQVQVATEVDLAPVAREDRAPLGFRRVSELTGSARRAFDDVEVAVGRDRAPPAVGGDVAAGQDGRERVRLLIGDDLGVATRSPDAIQLPVGMPILSARQPPEVDPLSVIRPPDPHGRLPDELGAAHDAPDREGERVTSRRGRLVGRETLREQAARGERGARTRERESRRKAVRSG